MEIRVINDGKFNINHKGIEFDMQIYDKSVFIDVEDAYIRIPSMKPLDNLIDYLDYIAVRPEMVKEIKELTLNSNQLHDFGVKLKKLMDTGKDYPPALKFIKNEILRDEKMKLFDDKIKAFMNVLGGFRYINLKKGNTRILIASYYTYIENKTPFYIFKFDEKGLKVKKTYSKNLLYNLLVRDCSLKQSRNLEEKDINFLSTSKMSIPLKGLFADEPEHLKLYQTYLASKKL